MGPKFIFDNPKTAARRRTIELATLKRKLQHRFYERKIAPGRPVDQFIAELDLVLQKLHNTLVPLRRPLLNNSNDLYDILDQGSVSKNKNKKNYHRLSKRLKHQLKSKNITLQ